MTIEQVLVVEDCVDGSVIRELILSDELTPEAIRALAPLGGLEYFSEFPRPFFRVVADTYQVKGVQGTPRMRLWARRGHDLAMLKSIGNLLAPIVP